MKPTFNLFPQEEKKHRIYTKNVYKQLETPTFPHTTERLCICLHFVAILNLKIHVYLPLPDKPYNYQGKGV